MTKREIKAIEAKNQIAGEIKDWFKENKPMNLKKVVGCLLTIEAFIGVANLPSVQQIIRSKYL